MGSTRGNFLILNFGGRQLVGWSNSAPRRSLAKLRAYPSAVNSRARLRDPALAAQLFPARARRAVSAVAAGSRCLPRVSEPASRVAETRARTRAGAAEPPRRPECTGRILQNESEVAAGKGNKQKTTGKVSCVPTSHPRPRAL